MGGFTFFVAKSHAFEEVAIMLGDIKKEDFCRRRRRRRCCCCRLAPLQILYAAIVLEILRDTTYAYRQSHTWEWRRGFFNGIR